jgi:dTDP-4-amino-4,6-dideoxygalactose transaminase
MQKNRIYLSPPWMGGEERKRVDEAFASNYIAPCGPMVDRFEREFAATVGMPQACALSSGTAALDLLYHELDVARGDTVFCSDLTFVSSIAPAIHRGAVPVFIDCDASTWTMEPGLLEEALADAAEKGQLPKVVVAVDLYGQCCDYERIEAVCAKYNVPLIIDAAEALGARYYGRRALVNYCGSALVSGDDLKKALGTQRQRVLGNDSTNELMNSRSNELPAGSRHAGDAGWAAVYSFNGNKIITTSGGGMLASRDAGVVERARKRSQQSREPVVWYEHEELGYNYRMSNIVAAIGVGQLSCLERIIQKKRQIFEWYRQRLGSCVSFMPEAVYGRCTRWLTVVELSEKDEGRRLRAERGGRRTGEDSSFVFHPSSLVERVRLALEDENIESRPVWKPMHLQPVFREAKVYGGAVSDRLFENGLCLPSGTGLTEADVGRVCEAISCAHAI